ncbi:hypothetical protein [Streptosporangium sp. NPDC023615]|uniref:hypothetical protein n=1 Tax=Streptosporangium sp. NPDC023615 TaxID=3154794 RepID=UPI003435C0A9
MYGKRQSLVLGSALLATLALGPTSISQASAAPAPVQAAGSSQKASAHDPADYWRGYRDGYRAAGQDCFSRSSRRSFGRPSDYDRGWLNGYDAGYARFCYGRSQYPDRYPSRYPGGYPSGYSSGYSSGY